MTDQQCFDLKAQVDAEQDPTEKARLQKQWEAGCDINGALSGPTSPPPPPPGQ